MRSGIFTILFLIVVGVIAANVLTQPQGTKVVLDGLTNFWRTSVNGLLAHTSR